MGEASELACGCLQLSLWACMCACVLAHALEEGSMGRVHVSVKAWWVASILGISEPKKDDRVWQFGTH